MGGRAGHTHPAAVSAADPAADAAAHDTDAHDTVLWYRQPAAAWLEALPVGNGSLGAMCRGGIGRDVLHLNDETAWSGSPRRRQDGLPDAGDAADALARARAALAAGDRATATLAVQRLQHTYTQSYLPLADAEVVVSVGGEVVEAARVTDYSRRLDLATGVAEHSYRLDGHLVRTEVVASVAAGVLVVQVDSDHPGALTVDVALTSPLRVLGAPAASGGVIGLLLRMPSDVAPPHESVEPPVMWSPEPGEAMEAAVAALVVAQGGAATVYLATATGYAGTNGEVLADAATCFEVAAARVVAAAGLGAAAVRSEAVARHGELFDRVRLELPAGPASVLPTDARLARHSWRDDQALIALVYHHARYLLIAGSAPSSALPATLQGLWNAELRPPWSCNFTVNINTQMNYWGAETTQLAECHRPLLAFVRALAVTGADTARRFYGAAGWVAHHNTDAWAYSAPVGRGAGDPAWANWPGAGWWLCRHLWEAFRFSGDTGELAANLPALRGAVAFAADWLLDDGAGGLGTSPSTSPENSFVTADGSTSALDRSSTMDVELVRDVLGIYLAALDALDGPDGTAAAGEAGRDDAGPDDTGLATWAAGALRRLPPLRIGSAGQVLEWATEHPEAQPEHRHLSHLYGFYPGDRVATPEQAAAVATTLDRRGADSTGWSLAWKLALRARIGDAAAVPELLDLALRPMPAVPADAAAVDSAAEQVGFSGGLYPDLFSAHPPFQIDGNLGFLGAFTEVLLASHGGEVVLLPALPGELASGSVTGLVARGGVLVDLAWDGAQLSSAVLRPRRDARGVRVRSGDRTVVVDLLAGEAVTVRPGDGGSLEVSRA